MGCVVDGGGGNRRIDCWLGPFVTHRSYCDFRFWVLRLRRRLLRRRVEIQHWVAVRVADGELRGRYVFSIGRWWMVLLWIGRFGKMCGW